MTWFEEVFGFVEDQDYEITKKNFEIIDKGKTLLSRVNNQKFHIGLFETPSLKVLNENIFCEENQAKSGGSTPSCGDLPTMTKLSFTNICGEVQSLHVRYPRSVFQVASQFNCLEMVGPKVTPDKGITIYRMDQTQGPKCALICPAGTLYRNYFVNGTGQGGEKGKQLNTIDDAINILEIAYAKQNKESGQKHNSNTFFHMSNGYALPLSTASMKIVNDLLLDEDLRERIKNSIKVGVHWDVEVKSKFKERRNCVTQVYCSACPVAYTKYISSQLWAPFASLCLEAMYENTLAVAATIASKRRKEGKSERVRVFLTSLGGGAFGNRNTWIHRAILKALLKYESFPLDVALIHYRSVVPSDAKTLAERFKEIRKKQKDKSQEN